MKSSRRLFHVVISWPGLARKLIGQNQVNQAVAGTEPSPLEIESGAIHFAQPQQINIEST